MSSPGKRRESDIMKLMMSDWEVQLIDDSISEFSVMFKGPSDSVYEGGWWSVRVELPDAYPYKSPSIGFQNKIYHPNVDETAGSVCLDVINQTWTPMYDLVNVFEQFLPQLLLYPNASDPLNGEAASLLMRNPVEYKQKVKDYIVQFATESLARKHDKHVETDDDAGKEDLAKKGGQNDGFLPDSDEDEDPPTTGHMTI